MFTGTVRIQALAPRPIVDAAGDYDVPAYGFARIDGEMLVGLDFIKTKITSDEGTDIDAQIEGEVSGNIDQPGRVLMLRDPRIRLQVTRAPDTLPVSDTAFDLQAKLIFPTGFVLATTTGALAGSRLMVDPMMPMVMPDAQGATIMAQLSCTEAGDTSCGVNMRLLDQAIFGTVPKFGYDMSVRRSFTCTAP